MISFCIHSVYRNTYIIYIFYKMSGNLTTMNRDTLAMTLATTKELQNPNIPLWDSCGT